MVLGDVVDHGHHHAERLLPGLQIHVHSGEMHKHKYFLFVPVNSRLPYREDVRRDRRNGEAERDGPLELVLDNELRLNLVLHQMDDVLEGVSGAVEEAAETVDCVGSIGRGNHLGVKKTFYCGELVRLPLTGVIWAEFEVERLEGVLRVDVHLALQGLDLEGDDTRFIVLVGEIREVFLRLDDVLELPSHEDTAKKSVKWRNNSRRGEPRYHSE